MNLTSASEGRGGGGGDCPCPHVVDIEWFGLLLAALGFVAFFLGQQINQFIMMGRRRRRRRSAVSSSLLWTGN